MGKFIVKETEKTVHFNLVASNGEVIGSSQNYSTKDGCMNGIESVRKNAEAAKVEDQTVEGFETETNPKFEIYEDKAGEFRFRLKARNGEIILSSEGEKAKAPCKNGIESVRKNASEAKVEEAE